MTRVKNPLPDRTDGEVLKMAAALFDNRAKFEPLTQAAPLYRATAARLRAIARRVPLWTDNRKGA